MGEIGWIMYYKIDENIVGGIDGINCTVNNILNQTKLIIVDEDLLFDLRLILNEVLINAFEHGNNKDMHKLLSLCLVIDDIELKLRVKDEGLGFCLGDNCADISELASHGRGLMIVENLSDCLQVEDNVVRCILYRH